MIIDIETCTLGFSKALPYGKVRVTVQVWILLVPGVSVCHCAKLEQIYNNYRMNPRLYV